MKDKITIKIETFNFSKDAKRVLKKLNAAIESPEIKSVIIIINSGGNV